MKNFDETRAQRRSAARETFQIGGQTFTVSDAVHPDELAAFDAIDESSGITETLAVVDRVLLSMIADQDDSPEGGHVRYRAVRENRADPITVADLLELAEWLIGAQTDRPPTQPDGSSTGPGGTGTT